MKGVGGGVVVDGGMGFRVWGSGYLDRDQIEEGFRKMDIPPEYRFARELLEACDKVGGGMG